MFKALPLPSNVSPVARNNVFILESSLSHAWATALIDAKCAEMLENLGGEWQDHRDAAQTAALNEFIKTGAVLTVEDGVDMPYASWTTASGTLRYAVAPNGDTRVEYRPRVPDGAPMAILNINADGVVSLELAGYARLLETVVGGNGWRFKNAEFKATTDGDWYAPLAERSWFETDPMNRQDRMWELLECSCRWFNIPLPARPVATALPPVNDVRVVSEERW